MPSAATRIVQLAKRDYRLVRDADTKTVYGLPLDESHEPVQLEPLVELCAERDFRDQGAVPSASAKRDALALLRAIPVEAVEEINRRADALSEIERAQAIDELAIECLELARSSSILAELDRELVREGFAGNTLVPRTVFLAGQSTHLDVGRNQPSERLVSVKVDGPSAAGKNYAVEAALAFLPDDFAIPMTAMSERALVTTLGLSRGMPSTFLKAAHWRTAALGTLILRSLLSENRIQYPTVVTDSGFPETVFIEREGPVMAVIATSAIKLDRDLETRLLHLRIDDSERLTEEIIRRHGLRAQQGGWEAPDRAEWHTLFSWLRLQGPFRVRIPFAVELAELIPAKAVRLRRDVGLLMTLIGASAVLHLATRATRDGFVIATLDDYRSVRELIDTALGAGVGSSLPPWARETYVNSRFRETGASASALSDASSASVLTRRAIVPSSSSTSAMPSTRRRVMERRLGSSRAIRWQLTRAFCQRSRGWNRQLSRRRMRRCAGDPTTSEALRRSARLGKRASGSRDRRQTRSPKCG